MTADQSRIRKHSFCLRLSLMHFHEAAVRGFRSLKVKARAVAIRKFTPEIQLAVTDWLEMRCEEFDEAIKKAMNNAAAATSQSKA
jgi:hypothetical protein